MEKLDYNNLRKNPNHKNLEMAQFGFHYHKTLINLIIILFCFNSCMMVEDDKIIQGYWVSLYKSEGTIEKYYLETNDTIMSFCHEELGFDNLMFYEIKEDSVFTSHINLKGEKSNFNFMGTFKKEGNEEIIIQNKFHTIKMNRISKEKYDEKIKLFIN